MHSKTLSDTLIPRNLSRKMNVGRVAHSTAESQRRGGRSTCNQMTPQFVRASKKAYMLATMNRAQITHACDNELLVFILT
jgi:hypothetical protein